MMPPGPSKKHWLEAVKQHLEGLDGCIRAATVRVEEGRRVLPDFGVRVLNEAVLEFAAASAAVLFWQTDPYWEDRTAEAQGQALRVRACNISPHGQDAVIWTAIMRSLHILVSRTEGAERWKGDDVISDGELAVLESAVAMSKLIWTGHAESESDEWKPSSWFVKPASKWLYDAKQPTRVRNRVRTRIASDGTELFLVADVRRYRPQLVPPDPTPIRK